MSVFKIFVHGVPDCPEIWSPLLEELGLPKDQYATPMVPGFISAPPAGFSRDKDSYAAQILSEIERAASVYGPIDLVGHDWGALLTLRVAGLRPDLVRTWAVANGAFAYGACGHRAARLWNMPVIGNVVMALTSPRRLRQTLLAGGMPEVSVARSVEMWQYGEIKRSILGLYRSANGLTWQGDWVETLDNLPKAGLVLWGADDPYGDVIR